MRRCSFSASVLARFLGGRFVVGVGSSCPHDLRFFTGFFSVASGVAEGLAGLSVE